MSAYHAEKLTPREASNYLLGLRVKHFEAVERWCYWWLNMCLIATFLSIFNGGNHLMYFHLFGSKSANWWMMVRLFPAKKFMMRSWLAAMIWKMGEGMAKVLPSIGYSSAAGCQSHSFHAPRTHRRWKKEKFRWSVCYCSCKTTKLQSGDRRGPNA